MSENNNFTEIALADLKLNPFEAIGKDWLLITAGDAQKANTMTASWGGMGVLWNENVAFVFIRLLFPKLLPGAAGGPLPAGQRLRPRPG